MKSITSSIRILFIAIAILAAGSTLSKAQDYYSGDASYQQFYDDLSPYGQWINDPQYGYVWVPDAGSDFRPYYSNGYWVNTEYGNTWVSSYNWGWAPFHYGRWTYSSFYGWTWIPGNEWGPAWVSWRSGGGSYGWAPLGPGISIDFSFGNSYYVPSNWWVFTPQQYILDRSFQRYTYGPRYNSNYVRQTTIVHNTYANHSNRYISGPRRNDMESAIGHQIQPVGINTARLPERSTLRGNNLNIYRPAIRENAPGSNERPRTFNKAEHPLSTGNHEAEIRNNLNRLEQNKVATPDNNAVRRDNINNRSIQDKNSIQQPASRPSFNRPDVNEVQRNQQLQQDAIRQQRARQEQQIRNNDINRRAQQSMPVQQQPNIQQRAQDNRFTPQAQPQIARPRQMQAPAAQPQQAPVQQQQRFEQRAAPRPSIQRQASPASAPAPNISPSIQRQNHSPFRR